MDRVVRRVTVVLGVGLLALTGSACESEDHSRAEPSAAVPFGEASPEEAVPAASRPATPPEQAAASAPSETAAREVAPAVAAAPLEEAPAGSAAEGGGAGGPDSFGGLAPERRGLGDHRIARSSTGGDLEMLADRGPHPAQLSWTTLLVTGELNERVAELPIQQKRRQLWSCYASQVEPGAPPSPAEATVTLDSENGLAVNVTLEGQNLVAATLDCLEATVRSFEFTRSGHFEFRLAFALEHR